MQGQEAGTEVYETTPIVTQHAVVSGNQFELASVRNSSIDVLKGFGILCVITNHCFARGSRKFGIGDVSSDPVLYFLNRLIHFAVPLFLFVSCALLTQSLVKRFELRRYAKSRWRRTVVPYLLASLAYFLLYNGLSSLDVEAAQSLGYQILTGKASFHLYFTVVLIQATLIIPILVFVLGGRSLNWKWALGAGLVLQFCFYLAQREIFQLVRPASFFFWYCIPILVGVAVGTNRDLKDQLRASAPVLLGCAVILGLLYSTVSIGHLYGLQAPSDLINILFAAYSGLLALSLWVLVHNNPHGVLQSLLASLGRVSLPLFLVHPAAMYFMGGPTMTNLVSQFPLNGFIYWAFVLGSSFLFAQFCMLVPFTRFLLGEKPKTRKGPVIARA